MARAWKIAPGEQADTWDMCRDQGCIALGWRELPDFKKFKSEKAILKALSGDPGDGKGAAKSIWRFARVIDPYDIVIANAGRSAVVGIGVVKTDYLPPGASKNPSLSEWLPHARLVDWVIKERVDFNRMIFAPPTITLLTAAQCERIKRAYLKKHPGLKKKLDQLFAGLADDEVEDAASNTKTLATLEQHLEDMGAFNPKGLKDARERVLSSIVRRRGQPAFRRRLLAAYKGCCAICGSEVPAILEAAHIVPYLGPKTNHPSNGLLLRSDLHTLFDLHLLAVDVDAMTILVSSDLTGSEYGKYEGKPLALPSHPAYQPSREALARHRQKSRL